MDAGVTPGFGSTGQSRQYGPRVSADGANADREVGDALRAARVRAGLTIVEVADRIKVRPAIVDAIELGKGHHLLPRVYVRGHVQGLARALGVDADALLDRLATTDADNVV